jgi:hypothetical protein
MAVLHNEALFKLAKIYVNDCWKLYNKNEDEFVVKSINGILEHKVIVHESCVFALAMDSIKNMVMSFEHYNNLIKKQSENVDEFRNSVTLYLKLLTASVEQTLSESEQSCKCNKECQVYKYKEGETFVK